MFTLEVVQLPWSNRRRAAVATPRFRQSLQLPSWAVYITLNAQTGTGTWHPIRVGKVARKMRDNQPQRREGRQKRWRVVMLVSPLTRAANVGVAQSTQPVQQGKLDATDGVNTEC